MKNPNSEMKYKRFHDILQRIAVRLERMSDDYEMVNDIYLETDDDAVLPEDMTQEAGVGTRWHYIEHHLEGIRRSTRDGASGCRRLMRELEEGE